MSSQGTVPSTAPPTPALQAAAREWVLKLASNEMSAADFAALQAWRAVHPAHESAFSDARRAWRNLRSLEASFERRHPDRARRFEALWRRSWLLPAGVLAGAVLALVGFLDPLTTLRAEHLTARGEVREVTLPDGSRVVLNTHTALDVGYERGERRVALLRGEAWFQVHRDPSRPFLVRAGKGTVRALGTAFGVRAGDDDSTTVLVTEGTVAVSVPERPSWRLSAGERIVVGSTTATASAAAADVTTPLSWRDRRVVIVNRPLKDAVAELRRYHSGLIVVLGSAAERRITGTFDIDAIDDALNGIAAARNLHVMRVTPLLTILR